jgi:two-component system, NtrC family, response regulator AlgB
MQRAVDHAQRVAACDIPVLLSGESGTGKRVLAAAIHDWSGRREQPFTVVSCTTAAVPPPRSESVWQLQLPSALRESRRSRFELVTGGTLFFDEVCDLAPELQPELLRLLGADRSESLGEPDGIDADARVIAGTARDLEAAVRAGFFREDLFFRLNVVSITLPPLRERRDDLTALTDHVLAALGRGYGRATVPVAAEVRRLLAQYSWPGNVRELVAVLERAVALSGGEVITTADLPPHLLTPRPTPAPALQELERRHVVRAIAECPTLEAAAARLGVNPSTLWRKRKRLGLK